MQSNQPRPKKVSLEHAVNPDTQSQAKTPRNPRRQPREFLQLSRGLTLHEDAIVTALKVQPYSW